VQCAGALYCCVLTNHLNVLKCHQIEVILQKVNE